MICGLKVYIQYMDIIIFLLCCHRIIITGIVKVHSHCMDASCTHSSPSLKINLMIYISGVFGCGHIFIFFCPFMNSNINIVISSRLYVTVSFRYLFVVSFASHLQFSSRIFFLEFQFKRHTMQVIEIYKQRERAKMY